MKIEHGLSEYKVEPMTYIIVDTGGFNDPIVVKCSKKDIAMAWEGFSVRGWEYEGIHQILKDISWSLETGNWGHTRDVSQTGGIVPLQLQYE